MTPSRPALPWATRAAACVLASAIVGVGACGVDVEPRAEDRTCAAFPGEPGDRGVVVTSTAYKGSSVVSLVSWDGTTQTVSLWSSARRAPGLVTALSDDVGASLSPDPRGDVSLFDRTTGVLTWISPTSCALQVEAQAGSEGLRANPYDVVTSATLGRTFVARFDQRQDGSEGGDVLVLGDDRRTPVGRIPLQAFVTVVEPSARPSPARLILQGDRLFVLLQGFYGDATGYEHAVDATLVEIDAVSLAPKQSLPLPGLKNCGALIADGDRRLITACSGVLVDDRAARIGASGLATIDLGGGKMTLGRTVPAAATIDQSFKPTLALLPSGRVLTAGYGALNGTGRDARDRWISIALDPAAPAPSEVLEVAPYDIGDVACRGEVCWGADATGGGRLRRFEERAGVVSITGELVLDATLPPRGLGRF